MRPIWAGPNDRSSALGDFFADVVREGTLLCNSRRHTVAKPNAVTANERLGPYLGSRRFALAQPAQLAQLAQRHPREVPPLRAAPPDPPW